MIRWFAKNHVAANILMLAILLFGGYTAYFNLPVEIEPSIEYPQVHVRVPLRGGSPKDVEQKIVLPVESAMADISEIDEIFSEADRNNASFRMQIDRSADIDKVKNEISARIERISTFPSESEKPTIFVPNSANWLEVISVAVYGDLSNSDLLSAAKKVRDDLTSIDGISKVEIKGQRSKKILIEAKPEILNSYNLSLTTLTQKIREASIDLSAGSVNNNGERILIRSSSQAYEAEQFSELVISRENGSELRLKDVATVRDSLAEDEKVLRYNGQNAILIEILRLDGENSLKIANSVHDYVAQAKERFPEGVNLATWDDDSISLKGRLNTLMVNLLQGGILVLIFLGLFLRPQIAFWVVAGIPISFAGGIIAMHYLGVSANNMSLFGFILVLGIVVDDAIVTGENIYSRIRDGKLSSLDAAVIGTQEVATPVTFGMITTIAAFVPLMFIEGHLGEMARQIPLVVIPVLLFSLVESKFILPAHLKHLKTNRKNAGWLVRTQRYIADGLEKFIQRVYKPILDFSLRHRYSTISLFVASLLLTIGWYVKTDNFNPAPSTDRYFIFATLDTVAGTSFEETDRRVQQVVDGLDSIRNDFTDSGTGESLIGNVVTSSGGKPWHDRADPTEGYVLAEIVPPGQRTTPGPKNAEIAEAWQDAVGEMPGVRNFYIRGEQNNSRGQQSDPIRVTVRSNNDEERVGFETELKEWLRSQENIRSAWSDRQREQRELDIQLNGAGREAGLTQGDLAQQVRNAFYGTQVQKFQTADEELEVMLTLPEEQRESLHTLDTLRVSLPNGQLASISQLATVSEGVSPRRIKRKEGARFTEVAAVAKTDYKITKLEPELTAYLNKLALDYPSVHWNYEGELAEYKKGNKRIIALAVILTFTLYSLLAIPFKSFLQPFFVMLAVPFGVIGAYWGHIILDIDVSYLSFFGMLALAGVVVNDSLVIVDFINKKVEEGMPLKQAIAESGIRRFRPIMLTSLTTFAGLMPIIFESSIQAQFLIPMAVSLGFGILFATVITLFLIPCAYAVSSDFSSVFKRKSTKTDS
ncbi:efflux RND transporter permease subunit [Rubritalea spongiae]|uniref:Efflux RND transporter permease subunit n=1 Tax=Rubritalea spongiae TaxID=430797 RepID=A0ABW5DY48_9BACT